MFSYLKEHDDNTSSVITLPCVDDEDGYYCAKEGEILNDRYRVIREQGRGVFSNVLLAIDIQSKQKEDVAIKIIRCNGPMTKAGCRERDILMEIKKNDKHNNSHCIRILCSFIWKKHLCIVLEPMKSNLRQLMSEVAESQTYSLPLDVVSVFARNLFTALKYLLPMHIVHCDVKPDNMLVNTKHNVLKLCDFGTATYENEVKEWSPYMVARYYRAPEIILGTPVECSADIWSAGCCLYEMVTGRVCFKGRSNFDLLRLFIELNGPFPSKMLTRSRFGTKYFSKDETGQLILQDSHQPKKVEDIINNNIIIISDLPKRNLKKEMIRRWSAGTNRGERKHTNNKEYRKRVELLAELVQKCVSLVPGERPTPREALRHTFFL